MEYIGFDRQRNAIYEGEPRHGYRVMPPPMITPIRFMENDTLPEICRGPDQLPIRLFREDYFDSVTKIKRGRVFSCSYELQPQQWYASDAYTPPNYSIMGKRQVFMQPPEGTITTKLATYLRDTLADQKNLHQKKVVLGQDSHISYWKVIGTESNLVGTPVLTLKATHTYNDIPTLVKGTLDPETEADLLASLEKIESSINRQSATEVVDRCRDALSIAFGYCIKNRTKDLSEAIRLRKSSPDKPTGEDDLCSLSGKIVARLHSRGKPNEQSKNNVPMLNDHDSDLALSCLRTALRELGYASHE